MVQPAFNYAIDLVDPRAPSEEQWARMSPEERANVVAMLSMVSTLLRNKEDAEREQERERIEREREEERERIEREREEERAEAARTIAELRAEIERLKAER